MSFAARARRLVNRVIQPFGIKVSGIEQFRDSQRDRIFERVRDFTQTSRERVSVLCDAIEHVVRNNIKGDFVECGVWRGGSAMAAALTLLDLKVEIRDIHLFDTFAGMPPTTSEDWEIHTGKPAQHEVGGTPMNLVSLEEVRDNMASTGYDMTRVHFYQGLVEDTVPMHAPEKIAVLRLDTDWYASTKHELEHLWPRVTVNGFLLIDDYGHYAGAKKAVDEYFKGESFLFRIDYTGRLVMKS